MSRKKKAAEPEAIVHTRALLIKQSEELQKLMVEQKRILEQAQRELVKTGGVYTAVTQALEKLKDMEELEEGKQRVEKMKAAVKRPQSPPEHSFKDAKKAIARKFFSTKKAHSVVDIVTYLTMELSPMYNDITYGLVWYYIDKLAKEKKLVKVAKGAYRWRDGAKSPFMNKKVEKKAVARAKKGNGKNASKRKKNVRGGKPRTAWMDPADKLLAEYEMLAVTDLRALLEANKSVPRKAIPTNNAISKYLQRQLKKGNLQRPMPGYYCAVD